MKKLTVSIDLDGELREAGSITGSDISDAEFQYCNDYLVSDKAAAISLSLPLRAEAFSPTETRNFFEGLLPEGFTRRSVASSLHADENDYLTILAKLGSECLGAIRISDNKNELPEASYIPLSVSDVAALAAEGASRSAEIITKTHLSLTGASGKVGLYFDAPAGQWYLPQGNANSVDILMLSE